MILNIKIIKKNTSNTVITINQTDLINIVIYFFKTIKGMKALEYRI